MLVKSEMDLRTSDSECCITFWYQTASSECWKQNTFDIWQTTDMQS